MYCSECSTPTGSFADDYLRNHIAHECTLLLINSKELCCQEIPVHVIKQLVHVIEMISELNSLLSYTITGGNE